MNPWWTHSLSQCDSLMLVFDVSSALPCPPFHYSLFHVLHLTFHVILLCSQELDFIQQLAQVLLTDFCLLTLHQGNLRSQIKGQPCIIKVNLSRIKDMNKTDWLQVIARVHMVVSLFFSFFFTKVGLFVYYDQHLFALCTLDHTFLLMCSNMCSCPWRKYRCWNSVSSLSGFTRPLCSMLTTLRKPSKHRTRPANMRPWKHRARLWQHNHTHTCWAVAQNWPCCCVWNTLAELP